ncbi:MAG: response regulator [Anaerolineae bacterium]|nr:response regulator [Anaerolineae bacterium]
MTEQSATILVVDDNEMNRDMLARRLERQNYKTVMADNGQRALELLREQPFDLVLLDIMMPKMNGYEVLETVKADEALKNVPIIMISAVDDLDSVVKCIEMGAEDYLFKPFNPVLLRARINASLERKRIIDNAAAGSNPELHPLISGIRQDVLMLKEQSGNLNQDQLMVLVRLLENSRRALELFEG